MLICVCLLVCEHTICMKVSMEGRRGYEIQMVEALKLELQCGSWESNLDSPQG